MKRSEHTSASIASKAAALLAAADEFVPEQEFYVRRKKGVAFRLIMADVVSMAASLVTQTEDKSRVMRSGRLPRGRTLVKRHKPVTRNHKARK